MMDYSKLLPLVEAAGKIVDTIRDVKTPDDLSLIIPVMNIIHDAEKNELMPKMSKIASDLINERPELIDELREEGKLPESFISKIEADAKAARENVPNSDQQAEIDKALGAQFGSMWKKGPKS